MGYGWAFSVFLLSFLFDERSSSKSHQKSHRGWTRKGEQCETFSPKLHISQLFTSSVEMRMRANTYCELCYEGSQSGFTLCKVDRILRLLSAPRQTNKTTMMTPKMRHAVDVHLEILSRSNANLESIKWWVKTSKNHRYNFQWSSSSWTFCFDRVRSLIMNRVWKLINPHALPKVRYSLQTVWNDEGDDRYTAAKKTTNNWLPKFGGLTFVANMHESVTLHCLAVVGALLVIGHSFASCLQWIISTY